MRCRLDKAQRSRGKGLGEGVARGQKYQNQGEASAY